MSLDVTLKRKYHISYDGGETLEELWENLYSSNITHNLTEIAKQAGIYEALWRPYKLSKGFVPTDNYDKEYEYEQSVIVKSKNISDIIEKGLKDLKSRPEYFEKFNSPNGWGTYEHFVPFVEKYLKELKDNPEAIVEISR